jgi:CBS domain-containing protein
MRRTERQKSIHTKEESDMQVREIMTENLASCSPGTTLREVARIMRDEDVGAIPVIEREDGGRPVGIITDRDITVRAVAEGRNPEEVRVRDVMTDNVVTVRNDASVRECAEKMEQHQIRRMLVVDNNGACAGIVAQADIARHAPRELTGELVEEVSGEKGHTRN